MGERGSHEVLFTVLSAPDKAQLFLPGSIEVLVGELIWLPRSVGNIVLGRGASAPFVHPVVTYSRAAGYLDIYKVRSARRPVIATAFPIVALPGGTQTLGKHARDGCMLRYAGTVQQRANS